MKKSTLVVLIGGFIFLTAFLGPLSSEKMYKKQKNFNTPEEIIKILNTKPILTVKDSVRGGLEDSEDLSECLSVRKRLTGSDFGYAKIDVKEVIQLDKKSEKDLLDYYSKLRERFSKRLPINREKAVRLKINTYYYTNERTGEVEKIRDDNILDLVLIDEGEGYVIDFINLLDSSENIPDYSKIRVDDPYYYEHKNMINDVKTDEEIHHNELDSDKAVEDNA